MSPDRELEDFALRIEALFAIAARDVIVVTGVVRSGSIRDGEVVEIWHRGEYVSDAVAGIEMIAGRALDRVRSL